MVQNPLDSPKYTQAQRAEGRRARARFETRA